MTTDLSKLNFDSRQNYMKRSSFTGNTDLTLGGAYSSTTHTINHNLGYIPFFIVGAEQDDATTIWSNNRVHEYTDTGGSGDIPVQLKYWCNTTTLTIRIENGTGSLVQSGDRTVYWIIYLDYSA